MLFYQNLQEQGEVLASSEDFKITLFYPVLYIFLNESKNRFNVDLIKSNASMNTNSSSFLKSECLNSLIEMYNLDKESIETVSILARRVLVVKDLNSPSNIFHLLHIALTICVTTAQCERSFSSLKRIKTCLRSTMSEQRQRLLDLAVLSNVKFQRIYRWITLLINLLHRIKQENYAYLKYFLSLLRIIIVAFFFMYTKKVFESGAIIRIGRLIWPVTNCKQCPISISMLATPLQGSSQ